MKFQRAAAAKIPLPPVSKTDGGRSAFRRWGCGRICFLLMVIVGGFFFFSARTEVMADSGVTAESAGGNDEEGDSTKTFDDFGGELGIFPEENLQESDFSPSDREELGEETDSDLDGEPGFALISPTGKLAATKLTASETSWGRFAPGSWIRTRTVGTTFKKGRNIKSVTETKTTLVEIQPDGYLLKREVTVKMGLRNHAKDPEYVKYNFYDLPFDDRTVETDAEPESLQISRKVIPCQVRRFERTAPLWQEKTTLWFSPVLFPFVFQKETEIVSTPTPDVPKGRQISHSKTTIQRTSLNFRLGNDITTWISQTEEEKGDSASRTKTFHSTRIPGGVSRETTYETDGEGNPLYQSVTVLLDYFIESY